MSYDCPDAIAGIEEALNAYGIQKSPPDTQDDDSDALAALVERVCFALDDRKSFLDALRDLLRTIDKIGGPIALDKHIAKARAAIVKAGEQI